MEHIIVWCPLPPIRTGPAFFLEEQIIELSKHANISIAISDQHFHLVEKIYRKKLPVNVKILSETVAHSNENSTHIIHIANHPEHLYCLNAAKLNRGYLILHDLSLHHLIFYQFQDNYAAYKALLMQNAPAITSRISKHLRLKRPFERSFYCIRFLEEIIPNSKGIIVHSEWARQLLRTIDSKLPRDHIGHIPLFSKISAQNQKLSKRDARKQLGLNSNFFIISIPGFLSAQKQIGRLLSLAEALDEFFDVKVFVTSSGSVPYLSPKERKLYKKFVIKNNTFMSSSDFEKVLIASDLVSCVRYPTTGESSGVYAKAIAAKSIPLVLPVLGMKEGIDLAVSFSLLRNEESKTVEQIRTAFASENIEASQKKMTEAADGRSLRITVAQLFNFIQSKQAKKGS